MNPEPTEEQISSYVKVSLPAKRRYIPNLASSLLALFVIVVLGALIMPITGGVSKVGKQTQSLARAKQIGLALKLFAGDHDERYPGKGIPTEMTRDPATSNAAFACLFPTYTSSEKIFGNDFSAYQTRVPDDVIDTPYTGKPVKTLAPGENVYAYVAGLTDGADPGAPIVLDGTDDHLYYNADRSLRGGVWKGTKAIVVYLDNHAAVENLAGPENKRYVSVNLSGRPNNLLDFSWLGQEVHLLNPAVAGR